MIASKLKRKTKNHLLSMARATERLMHQASAEDKLDHLHDLAMRAYAEGYTHGQASGRETEESKR